MVTHQLKVRCRPVNLNLLNLSKTGRKQNDCLDRMESRFVNLLIRMYPYALLEILEWLSVVWSSCCTALWYQEAIESVELDTVLNVDQHSKLHVLYGGTKVVQHTPPSKTGPGLKGICSCRIVSRSYLPSPLLPSNGQYLSNDDFLEDKREDYQKCSVLYSVLQVYPVICTLIWAVVARELGPVVWA